MLQGQEDLHEVIPYRVFSDRAIGFCSLLDDEGEVAATAVFHEYVKDAGVAVDEAVVVPNDVFVVEIFEDVPKVLELDETNKAICTFKGERWRVLGLGRCRRRRDREEGKRRTLLLRFASCLVHSSSRSSVPSVQRPRG